MKNKLLGRFLRPVIIRLGTALAAFLVGSASVEPEMANQVATGLVALCLIALDIFTEKVGAMRDASETDRSGR